MLTFVDAKKILELKKDVDHLSLKLGKDIVLFKFRSETDFKLLPDVVVARHYVYSILASSHDKEYPVFICIAKPRNQNRVDCHVCETTDVMVIDNTEFQQGHPCVVYVDDIEQKQVVQITATGKQRKVCRKEYAPLSSRIRHFDMVVSV